MVKSLLFCLILQLAGVGAIIAEFLLPSAGLLTVASIGAFGYSLYYVYHAVSPMACLVFCLVDLALIPIAIIYGIKLLAQSPLALKDSLAASQGAVAQDPALQALIGLNGMTLTDLRPAGRALIKEKKYDVVSSGDFINRDTPVVVAAVDSNRIVVKKSVPV